MTPPAPEPAPGFHRFPIWTPRFWQAWRFGDWIALCARNGFRIHPRRWPMALLITLATPFNSLLARLQRLTHGARIDAVAIAQPPIFIIGHWRSGTTLLHELMALDSRLATPTTYQCFAPRHFLLTDWLPRILGSWLLPRRRPMDDIAVGWDRPQEDEFALLTLGAPTPYQRMGFPNEPPAHMAFLDMEGCDPADLQAFETGLRDFAKAVTLRTGKRLLLKSPPHTGRIACLARLFPGARFIHLVRDPHALFPSTMRLWQALDAVQGMQVPNGAGLEEYVFDCLTRMYAGFEKQRAQLDPRTICDLRYEDLVRDPVAAVARIYRELGLDGFDALLPQLQAGIAERKDYRTNIHALDAAQSEKIRRRWGFYCDRYGY